LRYLAVKNFERFQHYKNASEEARPAWIKCYASLLHDYEFQSLPDKSKAHLMLIWLLVSQRPDRKIPDDAAWVQRTIGANDKVDLKGLVDGGWLIAIEPTPESGLEPNPGSALEQNRREEKREEEKRSDLVDEAAVKAPPSDTISVGELFESWNDICPPLGLPAVRELSPSRRQKASQRKREHPKLPFWQDVFREIKRSSFLLGRGTKNGKEPWKVTFDFLIENDVNCLKIAEGRYAQS
jgi:hypothetical protein